METIATILHADLDAFYASVEQLLDPSLRGKPIAVGTGVVLAASYEARAFGIGGGMPGRRARELCPHLIFVGGHFKDYQRLGDAAIKVLNDFTPLVERISIDEAFADVAGCTHLFGPPAEIARAVRRRVRAEVGLPISIGVARTKHLAKIASQVAKPDGLVVVDPDTELDFLHDLPVELMWGVGPVTRARLAEIGVTTIGQLAKMPGGSLERLLGRAAGEKLTALAWNRDPREIKTHRRAQSAGAQSALGKKPAEERVFRPTLRHLADRVATRLRAKCRPGRTVTVRVRFADLHSVTRSVTLEFKSVIADIPIYREAAIIDTDGKFHCSTIPIPPTLDVRDRIYFYEPLKTGKLTVGTITQGRVTHSRSIHLSMPYKDTGGSIKGVIVVILNLEKLAEILPAHPWRLEHRLIVLDRDGSLVLTVPPNDFENVGAISQTIFPKIAHAPSGTIDIKGPNGRSEIIGFVPQNDASEGLFTAVAIDRDSGPGRGLYY
jgi:DNA polymerase-4